MLITATFMILGIFSIFSHPLMLVILLISQSLIIVYGLSEMYATSWINYMVFLIFLGGLLVIFVYLSALIPNEMIKMKNINILYVTMVYGLIMSFNINFPQSKTNYMYLSTKVSNLSMNMTLMMLIYLLVALCGCMFFCSSFKSPTKQMIN